MDQLFTKSTKTQSEKTLKNIDKLTAQDLDQLLTRLSNHAEKLVLELRHRAARGELEGTDAWYQSSYSVFSSSPKQGYADFVRVIGYAYSWLVTIPKCAVTQEGFEKFHAAVRKVKKTEAAPQQQQTQRKNLAEVARQVLGQSTENYVAVSKILHFWEPSLAPMYDKRVKRALKTLGVKVPANDLDFYIKYWCLADRLIAHSKRALARTKKLPRVEDYRRLDELLFQFDKNNEMTSRTSKPASAKEADSVEGKSVRSRAGRSGERKVQIARQVVGELRGQPSKVVKKALIDRAQLTPAGASNYYYKLVRELGSKR